MLQSSSPLLLRRPHIFARLETEQSSSERSLRRTSATRAHTTDRKNAVCPLSVDPPRSYSREVTHVRQGMFGTSRATSHHSRGDLPVAPLAREERSTGRDRRRQPSDHQYKDIDGRSETGTRQRLNHADEPLTINSDRASRVAPAIVSGASIDPHEGAPRCSRKTSTHSFNN